MKNSKQPNPLLHNGLFRSVLKKLTLFLWVFIFLVPFSFAGEAQPNIISLMTDDQRWAKSTKSDFLPDEYNIDPVISSTPNFSSWLSLHPALTDVTAGGDPERDGIENVLEYVLNGDPTTADAVILPELDARGENLVFTFTRRVESDGDTVQVFQYGSDLNSWTDVNITDPTGAGVALGTPSDGLQTITVTVRKSVAEDEKLFGRLNVTVSF